MTRKSHNCAGTAFIQGDSAGGSKLIEQTLNVACLLAYCCCNLVARASVAFRDGPLFFIGRLPFLGLADNFFKSNAFQTNFHYIL